MESERRATASKAKDDRIRRESTLEELQLQHLSSRHLAASTLRATTTAAVMAQRTEASVARRDATDEVKKMGEALRREREEQRAKWRARGRQLNNLCVQSRNAASKAHSRVREHNLLEAHRSTAERLDMFRQSAEAQSALNDAKRMMAERVRREAGIGVVRVALTRANTEKNDAASSIRERSERDTLEAEAGRLQHLESHKHSACRVELEASPERVRELKSVEAARKASLTGGLRRQYRAFEVSEQDDIILHTTNRPTHRFLPAHEASCVVAYSFPCSYGLHAVCRNWHLSDVQRKRLAVSACTTPSSAHDTASLECLPCTASRPRAPKGHAYQVLAPDGRAYQYRSPFRCTRRSRVGRNRSRVCPLRWRCWGPRSE